MSIEADGIEPTDLLAPPFRRMAAASRTEIDGEYVVLYGSVLPWSSARTQAPYLAFPDKSAKELFARVLNEQVSWETALQARYPGEIVIWAGDFNQVLDGPVRVGSIAGRALLLEALDELGLTAWNAKTAHALDGLSAIDFICSQRLPTPAVIAPIDALVDGHTLSDHCGYLIEL